MNKLNLTLKEHFMMILAHEVAHWVASYNIPGIKVDDKITIYSLDPINRKFAGNCNLNFNCEAFKYILSSLAGPASDYYMLRNVYGYSDEFLQESFLDENGLFKDEYWHEGGDLEKIKRQFNLSDRSILGAFEEVAKTFFVGKESLYPLILERLSSMMEDGVFDLYLTTKGTSFTLDMYSMIED